MQRRLLRRGIEKLQGHLQRIGAVHVEALLRLAARPRRAAQLDLPGRLRAAREGDSLILFLSESVEAPQQMGATFEATFERPGEYLSEDWEWSLRFMDARSADSLDSPDQDTAEGDLEARMDADSLLWPLRVRTWLPGDRFVPLGLQGTKKRQDFFMDAKVERERRTRVPLLCDREKICWVVGLRVDERVKVTPLTRTVLVVRLRCRNPIPDGHAPGR
jgi:tRNA(Ile)-lysidine synthase